MTSFLKLLVILIAFSFAGAFSESPSANEHLFGNAIAEIKIEGNSKTQSDVVIYWSELKLGQNLSQQVLDLARQNILDTELFKQVSVEAESEDGRLIVIISLQEKRFNLI